MFRRDDGADFNLAAISWILNKHWNNPMLNETIKDYLVEALIQLPFWLNETGDLNTMQYWSENHQIGWKAGKYLIGQAFASHTDLQSLTFEASGMTGHESALQGKAHTNQWLDYRLRFGFSEFNSDTYGPIALKAVASVVGLADDPEIRSKAEKVLNLQLFDQIIGSKGNRISTARGRAYDEGKIGFRDYQLMYFVKGLEPIPVGNSESSMVFLALQHGYKLPTVFLDVNLMLASAKLAFPIENHFR